MRIAAYQGACQDGNVDANLAKAIDVFDQGVEAEADFLCMPETWICGYGEKEMVEAGAMTLDDPRVRQLVSRSAGHDMVFMVGMAERDGQQIMNTELIVHDGAILGAYRKTMLTGGAPKLAEIVQLWLRGVNAIEVCA